VSPTLLETLTPTKTEQTGSKNAPISNQFIELDFNEHTALVSATLRQSEYARIQKLYRQLNRENPDFEHRCLVHCAMGKSRSATAVLMFIMKLFSMKLDDAFEYVKTMRD
jgi:predicted protein tyrosine phosphatase